MPKHWASSSKPPIRNHRPSTAPERKKTYKEKSLELGEEDSERERELQLEVRVTKVTPAVNKKSVSLPNIGNSVPISILKNKSIGLSYGIGNEKSPNGKNSNELSIQFVKSIPCNDNMVDLFEDQSRPNTNSASNSPSEFANNSIPFRPDENQKVIESRSITMDTLRVIPSESKIPSDFESDKDSLEEKKPEFPDEDLKVLITPKHVANVTAKPLPKRPPWGARKSTTITFDPSKLPVGKSDITADSRKKKPLVPRLSKRRYRKKVLSSSSESDSEGEEIISVDGSVPVCQDATGPLENTDTPEDTLLCRSTQQPQPLKTPDVKKSPKLNPLTKLRISQYNLFSSTAGAFRGPGDPYYKFVVGGKSVRQGAQLVQRFNVSEVDHGKLDELLVDKSTTRYNTVAQNHQTLYKMRDKTKKDIEHSIHSKVDDLEKTRAFIITSMDSLQSHKQLVRDL
jgi:hypothetical protein